MSAAHASTVPAPGTDRATSTRPRRAQKRFNPSPGLIVAVLAITGCIVSLQQTLVVPVLPEFPMLLHTTSDNASWLVTATLLTSAVATPVVSRAADMYGKRRMMLLCLAMQIIGSAMGGLGDSLTWVVAGRALQGFAAALIPVGISIMRDELPAERVGGAVALMSATLGIGSGVGLPLAGLIYAHASWHDLFWVSAAMAAVMAVAVIVVVPESGVRTPGSFDVLGAVLLSAALVCLLLPISKGEQWGWGSERTLLLFLLAVLLVAAWVPWELRTRSPMVDLRTAARRPVLLTNCASLLVGFSMYGNMLSTTQLLQMPKITGYGFGLTVLRAGLCMLPSGLMMIVLSPVSAWITRRFGGRWTLMIGALVLALGYVGRVFLSGHVLLIIIGAALVSCGTAISYAAMPTLIMSAVPITETASANGLNSLVRSIGTSSSSAVVAMLLTSSTMTRGQFVLPTLDAFKHIFWVCALAALIAAAVAATLPAARERVRAAVRPADEVQVRGRVEHVAGRPVRNAVVTFVTLDGEQVDWGRTDNDGQWTIVAPEPGRYLRIVAADGWAPQPQVVEVGEGTSEAVINLGGRLHLTGVVSRGGRPVADAVVTLTKQSGELASRAHTDTTGRWELPLSTHGRHVLTALDPASGVAVSENVTLVGVERRIDLDLDAGNPTGAGLTGSIPGSVSGAAGGAGHDTAPVVRRGRPA